MDLSVASPMCSLQMGEKNIASVRAKSVPKNSDFVVQSGKVRAKN